MAGFNNSTGNSGLNSRTATSDYGKSGFSSNLSTNAVEILPNMNKTSVMKAGERLPQFVNEPPQSITVLINSESRISGSRFDFTADIGATIFRPRLINVDSVVIPKLYNITTRNNHIAMRAVYLDPATGASDNTGTPSPLLEFHIPPGYYTEFSIRNEFNATFNLESILQIGLANKWADWNFSNAGGIDKFLLSVTDDWPAVTMGFNASENSFAIYDRGTSPTFNWAQTPGGSPETPISSANIGFYFEESCSFIHRGRNFIPFDYPSPPPVIAPGFIVPRNLTFAGGIPSGTSALLYTRFCTLSSNALNRYSFSESRVSRIGDGGGRGKIISVIDTSYFQIESYFAGSFLPAEYPNASVINVNNAQGQLEQYLDFVVRDEYGDTLDTVMSNPYDRIGITFWLHVSF